MSLRKFLCVFLVLFGIANLAVAQQRAPEKMVRVTYPVADLITPIPGRAGAAKQDELAKALRDVITNTIAPKSWDHLGGDGAIQFFPLGNILVIHQTQTVQDEIARLLEQLRRAADVQVSVETRLVHVSPTMAKLLMIEMEEHGERARHVPESDTNCNGVTMDAKKVISFMKRAHIEDTAVITQLPKITMFNAQHASLASHHHGVNDENYKVDLLSVIDANQSVRMTLTVKHGTPNGRGHEKVTHAAHTFVIAPNRTLVWCAGETTHGHQLFVLATPRVLTVKDEGVIRASAEEQTIPLKMADVKERAIEYRLRQPISLNFKNVPFCDVIMELSTISGIQIVPDMRAFEEARIDMKWPVSCKVENVDMKHALRLLLNPAGLTCVIENQVLKITTEKRQMGKVTRVTYPVADLVEPPPLVAGEKAGKSLERELRTLIINTIAKDSWEEMGGPGSIQYFPAGKSLVISQNQDIHEEIQLLLSTLRKLQDGIVTFDVRFVSAPTPHAQLWRKRMNEHGEAVESMAGLNSPPRAELNKGLRTFVSMDERQIQLFLSSVSRGVTTLQAPQLRIYNGQRITFECSKKEVSVAEFRTPNNEPETQNITRATAEERPAKQAVKETVKLLSQHEKTVNGWRCELQPVVSPDRRYVRLSVNIEHGATDDVHSTQRITKAAKTFNVADGRTLVWDLGSSGNDQHLFVLVTPRIVVREEKEVIFKGTLQPIPGR